ncbi:MAG: hypothetical protein QOJ94_2311 [Sphingomonadales bacterium]|jgi:23S rRNA maturation-related 3'-5' exoribonuclease YhaM|nr:hypothetical protein [Sphingomonadales bacterium]
MADTINAQIIDVINNAQKATLDYAVVTTSGAGKAYQSISQSAAIAIQDATDALRNISTIATTTAGVAMAQFMATQDDTYLLAMKQAQDMMTSATADFSKIGEAAKNILTDFPYL